MHRGLARLICLALLLTAAGGNAAFASSKEAKHGSDSEDRSIVPMTFDVVATPPDCHCVVINASGEITDDTSRDFAVFIASERLSGVLPKERPATAILASNGPKVVIGFDSIGGKVVPALIMGRRIRQLGWTTLVGQAGVTDGKLAFESAGCYSACSMIMLGGTERLVVPRSKAGIHQFSPQFAETETFDVDAMRQIIRDYGRQVVTVYDYVQEMGVDTSFFIETMRTPFASMDVLPEDQWLKVGIATRLLPDAQDTPLADVLASPAPASAAVASSPPSSQSIDPAPAHTVGVDHRAELPPGSWTVVQPAGGPAFAGFADAARTIDVTVTCVAHDAARLNFTLKALDPVALERVRAAAFALRRLKIGSRELAIASVAEPDHDEQAVAASLDDADLQAMEASGTTLDIAVVDRAGNAVGHTGTIGTDGFAKAIGTVMDHCGA